MAALSIKRYWPLIILAVACVFVLVRSTMLKIEQHREVEEQLHRFSNPHTFLFCKDGKLFMGRAHEAWPVSSAHVNRKYVPCPLT